MNSNGHHGPLAIMDPSSTTWQTATAPVRQSTKQPWNGSRSTRSAKTVVDTGFNSKSVSSSRLSHTHLVSCPYTVNGATYSTNLPKNLAPGQYLVRHEIIALHLATQEGKAEFYPSCQQINVGGSGTGVPTQDELLSFPGAYSDTDPGIYTPNVRYFRKPIPINHPFDLFGISRSLTPVLTTSSPADPLLH